MSSFGSQSITTNLSSSYDPENEGVRQYNIIPYGIYDGLELSIDGPDTVQISGPGVGVIYDEVNNLAVQYQQHDNYILDVNPTEPYLIARWEYNQSLTNPVRYETDTQAGLASTDVVLGKVLFDQNDEVDGFDLSERVERDLENVEGFDTEADEGALYQSDGNGNVITVLSTQSNNTLARYNDSSGEWEAIQTDTSNTGNTVVERTSDGSVNVQDVNADGSVSGVTVSASDVFQWVQSLGGSNQTFLDLSPGDLNDSWTFDWIASSNQIRITTSAGNTVFLNPDGTIQHADANNNNESATLGQLNAITGNPVGTDSGDYWSEKVSTTIASNSVESVSPTVNFNSNSFQVSIVNNDYTTPGSLDTRVPAHIIEGETIDGNGNIDSVDVRNLDNGQDRPVTLRFSGVIS